MSGAKGEGYWHALSRTWNIFDEMAQMPVKSALSKKRDRVSFEFFKAELDRIISSYEPHRRTWRGLKIFATDGDQYALPATPEVFVHGYRGHACPGGLETYYPRMYAVHCYDVLGNVTKAFRYSSQNDEVALAIEIASTLESDSLTLYDRLYMGGELFCAHAKVKSFAVIRCKRAGTFKVVEEFFESSKRNHSFWIDDVLIELIKVVNLKTGELAVYATNLPRSRFKNKEIADLYALRWEAETANRDLTSTIRIEQWHSGSLNGILQELYVGLWLMNQARIQMTGSMSPTVTLEELFRYERSNFKLIFDSIISQIGDLVRGRYRSVSKKLKILIEVSRERRKRRSRSYPRQIKYARKTYTPASTVPRTA